MFCVIQVKDVVVRLDDLIERIKSSYYQVQRQHKLDEILSISFSKADIQADDQSSTELNGQFIHSQLLIDCLIRMESSVVGTEKHELIQYFKEKYKNEPEELEIIDEFERGYSSTQSIRWYTKESFLYRSLNKALRSQDIELLYLFRFFIRDLGLELEKHKCSSSVHVYRAQKMAKDEVEKLQQSLGEYISMNSFLSTSIHSDSARSFLSSDDSNFEKVLFKIDANPHVKHSKPFVYTPPFSFYPNEEEILFMCGSIFRINEVKRDKDSIWNIRLVLCSTDDEQLQSLFQHMKNELGDGQTNLLQFGHVLRDMGKLNDAEKYYRCYLKQLSDDHVDRALCYHALGKIASAKGDFKSSLKWFNKSLEMNKQFLAPTDPNLGCDYNSIATIYFQTGDDQNALESYEKALHIWKQAYGRNHICIAACLNNMGVIHQKQENYSKALKCYEKALKIRQEKLPENHIDLGESYNNIGSVNYYLDQYEDALEHYNLALKIKLDCLPPEHSSIAMTLENIGSVYEEKDDFQQALVYFKKASKIFHHSLPSDHPNVIKIDRSIERISSKLD